VARNSEVTSLATLDFCDERDVRFFTDEFQGKPYARKWKPVRFYIDKSLLPRPDFFAEDTAWVCNERAMLLAGEAMEMAGEYLPVEIENERGEFKLYHITNCINVLDQEKSQWGTVGPSRLYKSLEGYTYKELKRPAFRAERFGEETLFKIPENHGVYSYCLERTGDPEDGEFKAAVEHHGLTGLEFKLVWADDESVP
jgi:hypothetical protein